MQRNQLLAMRLKEVFLDGKWIANTNYQEQINSITWQQAISQIQNLNSIALLTFHINYYIAGLLQVFNGGKLEISDRYSFDMPEITTENEWIDLKLNFLTNAKAFCDKVADFDDTKLDEVFIEEKYGSYLRNIEAVLEHSYYHLGQVVLIKKMITQNN